MDLNVVEKLNKTHELNSESLVCSLDSAVQQTASLLNPSGVLLR